MKHWRTLIVDDERLAREGLKIALAKYSEIDIVGEAKNGEEAIELIEKCAPDLLFLDINMPEMDGFELLNRLEVTPRVVFTTAYDTHAIQAFEVNAFDYLVKPIDALRLERTMEKLAQTEFETSNQQVDVPFPKNKLLQEKDKVFIKDGEKCWFVEMGKIRLLESDGNYVKVYFDTFRPLVLRSLNSFEERLDPNLFFRANRKFIINLNYIDTIENWFSGGLKVTLKSGEDIEISRRQAIRFKEIMSL
jgi:two-component system LytT family response regulator